MKSRRRNSRSSGHMNRAIAILTAVLVLLAGLYQAWFGIQLPDLASKYSYATKGLEQYTTSLVHFVVWLRVEAALSAVAALALIVGGVMVFARKPAGRTLVILGCLLAIAHTAVGWVVARIMAHWFTEMGAAEEGSRWFDTPSSLTIALMALALPVIAGLWVLLPGRPWSLKMAIPGADRRIVFRN